MLNAKQDLYDAFKMSRWEETAEGGQIFKGQELNILELQLFIN